ncbi:MAG: tRNA pseudouridine(38-40) synthase TruA [Deltaproteobacteria bacterium]|nr:tRNA pseudouridine(38-40) synthase TruA [Deltaproteobacteria bacterium]
MSKYKLTLSYKGTRYCGWQVQPNGISIQEIVQGHLSQILQEPIVVKASGRTDAGVHAFAQVAHFSTQNPMSVSKILQGLRSMLPDDISIQSIEEVPDSFDAQMSAKKKTYVYLVNNSPVPNPFLMDYCWHVYPPLNLPAMESCLKLIVGEHDFTSFTASDAVTKTFVRTIYEASCNPLLLRGPKGAVAISPCEIAGLDPGSILIFSFTGSGFLKHMVRNLVGTIVNVGEGKISTQKFQSILASKDRRNAGINAPPQGLFLLDVEY